MIGAKTLMVLVAGAVIFVGGLLGGFAIHSYLSTLAVENLTVVGYTPKLLTEYAVEFTLVNSGKSDLQITDLKLDGYSNQTTNGWSQGWRGTTFLHPNQMGSLYWYAPCYIHVINQTMPQPTANPTRKEIEDLETWMSSYNCTFTFITSTAHQYSRTIQGLGYELSHAVTEWTTGFTFFATEELQITNVVFCMSSRTDWIAITVNNTGNSHVTLNEVWVNNVKKTTTPSLPGMIAASRGLVLNINSVTVVRGSYYQVKLLSSLGNQFLYSAYAPSS